MAEREDETGQRLQRPHGEGEQQGKAAPLQPRGRDDFEPPLGCDRGHQRGPRHHDGEARLEHEAAGLPFAPRAPEVDGQDDAAEHDEGANAGGSNRERMDEGVVLGGGVGLLGVEQRRQGGEHRRQDCDGQRSAQHLGRATRAGHAEERGERGDERGSAERCKQHEERGRLRARQDQCPPGTAVPRCFREDRDELIPGRGHAGEREPHESQKPRPVRTSG